MRVCLGQKTYKQGGYDSESGGQVESECNQRPVDQDRQIVYAPGYTGKVSCALQGYYA